MNKNDVTSLAIQYNAFMSAVKERDWCGIYIWSIALKDTQDLLGIELQDPNRLLFWYNRANEELKLLDELEEQRKQLAQHIDCECDWEIDWEEEADTRWTGQGAMVYQSGDHEMEVLNNGDY